MFSYIVCYLELLVLSFVKMMYNSILQSSGIIFVVLLFYPILFFRVSHLPYCYSPFVVEWSSELGPRIRLLGSNSGFAFATLGKFLNPFMPVSSFVKGEMLVFSEDRTELM